MRRFIRSGWFAALSIAVLVVGVAFLCAGCQASWTKDGGPGLALGDSAAKVQQHGQMIAVEGAQEGNPFTTLVGSVLSILGSVGVSVWGANKLNDRRDWTAEERADIKNPARLT